MAPERLPEVRVGEEGERLPLPLPAQVRLRQPLRRTLERDGLPLDDGFLLDVRRLVDGGRDVDAEREAALIGPRVVPSRAREATRVLHLQTSRQGLGHTPSDAATSDAFVWRLLLHRPNRSQSGWGYAKAAQC